MTRSPDYPLRATVRTSTGTIIATPAFFYGAVVASNGTGAASITLRDGGATGTVLANIVAGAANRSRFFMLPVPVKCATDIHVTLSANVQETVVYYAEES